MQSFDPELIRYKKRIEELDAQNFNIRNENENLRNAAAQENDLRRQFKRHGDLLSAIIDAVPVMIIICDPEMENFAINKEFTRLTGWTDEDLANMNILELGFPDPESREKVKNFFVSNTKEWMEIRWMTKDRKYIDSSWAHVQLEDHRQVAVGIDIRYRKKAEAELQRTIDNLAAANADLESFSHSISHDLRNSLFIIESMSEILEGAYKEVMDDDGRRCVAEIRDSVEKMSMTIEGLLRLSRVTRHELNIDNVNLSDIAAAVITELSKIERESPPEVLIEPCLCVKADRDLITIVLQNLLGNAWKYSRSAGSPLVKFGSQQKYGRRVFFVQDNGIGFSMSETKKIFTPFIRLQSATRSKGHGLGLAIVQRIIRRHGGRIWAEGEPGKGAVFYFMLPE